MSTFTAAKVAVDKLSVDVRSKSIPDVSGSSGRLSYGVSKIHNTIWVSPDHLTENQIYHICIGKTLRRSLEDVRVKRGADVASGHHLLVARLKLKLKKNWMRTATNRRKYNVSLLKDPQTRAEYKLNLANKFQVLQKQYEEEEPDPNSLWQNIKEILTSNCNKEQSNTSDKGTGTGRSHKDQQRSKEEC
ncbi:hypothetical protein LSH36_362g02018 [Paralvinella palmiformis]|uniref:Uncharacterized protein n=1 Tax=Paralvinella palmiformis TaxID=53620 RepID=A0AAD9JF41_9ANNE|nr:hypothetical protein LSH36_362g02018 [Paralvinella palmiformis]